MCEIKKLLTHQEEWIREFAKWATQQRRKISLERAIDDDYWDDLTGHSHISLSILRVVIYSRFWFNKKVIISQKVNTNWKGTLLSINYSTWFASSKTSLIHNIDSMLSFLDNLT